MEKYLDKIETLKRSIAFLKTQPHDPVINDIIRRSEKQLKEMTR